MEATDQLSAATAGTLELLDDDTRKHGRIVNGVPVMGLAEATQRFPSARRVGGVGDPALRQRMSGLPLPLLALSPAAKALLRVEAYLLLRDLPDLAERETHERKAQALTQHEPHEPAARCAKGSPYSDLATTFADVVRQHAVQTRRRHGQSEAREERQQPRRETRLRHRRGKLAGQTAEAVEPDARI